MQWLSHPHVYDVGNSLIKLLFANFIDILNLVNYFAMGQAAEKTHLAGGAKRTTEYATHLRGNADGKPVGRPVRVKVGYHHRLDLVIFISRKTEQEFHSTVA